MDRSEWNPVNNQLYIMSFKELYTIKPTDASLTLINNHSNLELAGLATDMNGDLYATDRPSRSLIKINPTTGNTTNVGDLGVGMTRQALCIDLVVICQVVGHYEPLTSLLAVPVFMKQ